MKNKNDKKRIYPYLMAYTKINTDPRPKCKELNLQNSKKEHRYIAL